MTILKFQLTVEVHNQNITIKIADDKGDIARNGYVRYGRGFLQTANNIQQCLMVCGQELSVYVANRACDHEGCRGSHVGDAEHEC
jgi:hypothetical protein